MVEIFDASALTVSPAMSAIIVRTAEIISKQLLLIIYLVRQIKKWSIL